MESLSGLCHGAVGRCCRQRLPHFTYICRGRCASETALTKRAAASAVSYSLNPFLPFRNANRVCVSVFLFSKLVSSFPERKRFAGLRSGFRRTFREGVGADAERSRWQLCCLTDAACPLRVHIGPAGCTVFTEICGEFATSGRADRVVGPYNAYSRYRTLQGQAFLCPYSFFL